MQGQPSSQTKGHKHFPCKRLAIIILVILVIIVVGVLNVQASVVLAALGVLIGLFQWLFPGPHVAPHPPQHDNIMEQPMSTTSVSSKQSLNPTNNSYSLPIFHVNAPLTDPNFFYGRELERIQLLRSTRNGTSTSIVGERRIGKTWLMSYLKLVMSAEPSSMYHIGYLDASRSSIKDISSFTKKALEALGCSPALLGHSKVELEKLERYLESMKQQNQIPVLCIDEFEWFKNNRQEFNLEFFAGMRAMTQVGLVIVTASRKSLRDVMGDILGETSPFFNIFEMIKLYPFSDTEAKLFIESKRTTAGFTEEESSRVLEYAKEYRPDGLKQWPPLRLQIVAQLLLDDKNTVAYHPGEQKYWQGFKERLDEKYREVAVK